MEESDVNITEKQKRIEKASLEEKAFATALEKTMGIKCTLSTFDDNLLKHVDVICQCNNKTFRVDFKHRSNGKHIFEIINDYGFKGSLFAEELEYFAHYDERCKEVWFISRRLIQNKFVPKVIMMNEHININALLYNNIQETKKYIIELINNGYIKTNTNRKPYELYSRYIISNKKKTDLIFEIPQKDIEPLVEWKFMFDLNYWVEKIK